MLLALLIVKFGHRQQKNIVCLLVTPKQSERQPFKVTYFLKEGDLKIDMVYKKVIFVFKFPHFSFTFLAFRCRFCVKVQSLRYVVLWQSYYRDRLSIGR